MIPPLVQTCLDTHGLKAIIFEPGSTPTSEMAAYRLGVAVGQIAKSMLFKSKIGIYHLIVCAGDQRVCNKRLKQYLGVKARMATAEETLQCTGFYPGGVCPFGVTQAVIHIDISLKVYEQVYPAAGTDASAVPTNYQQLLTITQGNTCDVMKN